MPVFSWVEVLWLSFLKKSGFVDLIKIINRKKYESSRKKCGKKEIRNSEDQKTGFLFLDMIIHLNELFSSFW